MFSIAMPMAMHWDFVHTKFMEVRSRAKEELVQGIERVWNDNLFMEILHTLIASMPKHMEVVISARGGSTRW